MDARSLRCHVPVSIMPILQGRKSEPLAQNSDSRVPPQDTHLGTDHPGCRAPPVRLGGALECVERAILVAEASVDQHLARRRIGRFRRESLCLLAPPGDGVQIADVPPVAL